MSNGGPDRFCRRWWCTFVRKPMFCLSGNFSLLLPFIPAVWPDHFIFSISHKYGSTFARKPIGFYSLFPKFSLTGHFFIASNSIWNLDTMVLELWQAPLGTLEPLKVVPKYIFYPIQLFTNRVWWQ